MADDEAADLSGDEVAAADAAAAVGGYSRAGSCAPSGSGGAAEVDSGSEDDELPVEEFVLDEQEEADTTARQHTMDGRDVQGIPWEGLQVSRDRYRQQRLQQYRNYMNCIPEEQWAAVRQELVSGWPQPTPLVDTHCPYSFVRNWRAVSSSIVHFQLRNLLWASSAHDVFVVYDNRVQHWNSVTRSVGDVLDLRGAPKGPRLPGLGRVQVSTLCVSGELLAAGGFTGELVLARVSRHDPTTDWGEEENDDDAGYDDDWQLDWGGGGLNEWSAAGKQGKGDDIRGLDGQAQEQQQQWQQQQQQPGQWGFGSAAAAAAGDVPLWSAAGSSLLHEGQEGRVREVLQYAVGDQLAATQQYMWSWEQMQQQQQQQQQQPPQAQGQWSNAHSSWQQQPTHQQQQQPGKQRQGWSYQQQRQQQQWPPGLWQQQQGSSRMLQQHSPGPWQQQQRQQQHEQEHIMGAAGPAAAELLHSCRVTQSENGITNGIEISDSCSYGACVMTSNNDCCVRLFDVEGCRPRQRLTFPFAVNYATLRPDGVGLGGGGMVAVVGDDPRTWLMDCRSGLEVMKLEGHRDFSFAVAWHPAGQLLATGNQDSTTRVWDVRQASAPLAVLGGTMGAIRALRFSPDGSFLAAAEPADFVHVYDVGSGFADVQEIDLFGEVAGIAFSPDAQALFVSISDTLYSSLVQFQRTGRHSTMAC